MKLSKKLTIALMVAFGVASLPLGAQAQSTCADASDLQACGHAALLNCRDLWGCSDDRAEATSVTDVVIDTAAECCGLSSKKQNKCFKKNARKLSQAAQKAPVYARRLLRQARNQVLTSRCDTGSLGDL